MDIEETDGARYMEDDEVPYTEEEINEEIERYRKIVLSACSSLGNTVPVSGNDNTSEGDKPSHMEYAPSSDCLASLKDIKRYIQMDEQGDGKWVLQWLGEWEVLVRDIIPIFKLSVKRLLPDPAQQQKHSESDKDYLLKTTMMCVELFVFLTWSMDTESDEVKTRFIRILRTYKRAFADRQLISSMLSVAVMYIRKSHSTDKEAMLIKGILYVFRNVLAIPDPLVSPTSTGLAQIEVHDTLIAAMDKELAVDFFLTLASSADQNHFKDLRPILLDIIYYLFYRVPVSALFKNGMHWFKDGEGKRQGRHTNFGGVYAVSTGEGTIMPVFNTREVLSPFANLFKKQSIVQKPKNPEQGLVDREWRNARAEGIAVLRRIASVFIESCFNIFIPVLFEDAKTNAASMKEQLPRLLYISGYFVDMSLANPAIDLGCTCALVQTHVFAMVMRNTNDYLEMRMWASLEPAMYCIQQILHALVKMRDTKLGSFSDNVLSNLFYDGDALDLFVRLGRAYKPTKNTRRFLEQAVETVETFLNTLKAYAESRSNIFVKKRIKRRAKRSSKDNKDETDRDSKKIDGSESGPETEANKDEIKNEASGNDEGGEDDEAAMAEATAPRPDENEDTDEEAEDEGEDTEDAVKDVLVERALNLEKFERAFATTEVLKAYSHLLAPPTAIEYVYPMIYRAAVTCQKPHLFFKNAIMKRLLVLYDARFTFSRRTEMLDLASWIFRQYITVMSSPVLSQQYRAEDINNKLAMECMQTFLKTSQLGKSVKPVITRHLIELYAEKGADNNAESNGG
ncbi:Topoisomerase 1-associated factor 1, partial [Dipsacomyces acuminosporus]